MEPCQGSERGFKSRRARQKAARRLTAVSLFDSLFPDAGRSLATIILPFHLSGGGQELSLAATILPFHPSPHQLDAEAIAVYGFGEHIALH